MTEAVIYVVDDDDSVRRALGRLLKSAGFRVVTLASSRDFLKCPPPSQPCCLVLDVRLPGLNGLELQEELVASGRETPIVFITGHGTIPLSVKAMKAGAVDFLEKPLDESRLLDLVHEAVDRDRRARSEQGAVRGIRERYTSLTSRERQVMNLVVAGLLNKQTANELEISEKTIKVHRARIMRKMRADSLPDLVRMAERLQRQPVATGRQLD